MKKISESKVEAKVVDYCRKRSLYCRKFSSPAHRGVPDRVIGGFGKVLFLELKRPGEEPTALQRHELAAIAAHGLNSGWASSFESARGQIDAVLFPSLI